VRFDQVFLPEFTRTRWLGEIELVVFDDHGKSAYDIIIGRDIMEPAGLDVMFSTKSVSWDEFSIPFHPRLQPVTIETKEYPDIIKKAAQDSYHALPSIKPSDYDTQTTGADIAAQQSHLEPEHRTALAAMLAKHDAMFNRVLGKYPDGRVRLQLVPGATPIHCKPYTVPHRNLKQFKRELDTLLLLDVIEPVLVSEWVLPFLYCA
jgi:hypothetical protein